MKKRQFIILLILISLVGAWVIPFSASAWLPGEPLIPCGQANTAGVVIEDQCDFADFVQAIANVIDAMLYIATLIAACVFAYAGFTYATSGGNPSKKSEANRMFVMVLKGFVIALSAWLIVKFIETSLLSVSFVGSSLLGP